MISKVAETLALKRSFAINGVVTEEEIGRDEPAQEKPEANQKAPAPLSPFQEMIRQFGELKARLPPDTYYEVLGEHGVRHCNEFKDLAKARAAYRQLREKVHAHEAAQQLAEEAEIIDVAAPAEEIKPPAEETNP
jgi:hypothetical protein